MTSNETAPALRRRLPELFVLVLAAVVAVVVASLSLTGGRSPRFWDYLGSRDVTSQYTSELPPSRYLLEPVAGVTFAWAGKGIDWWPTLLLSFAVARGLAWGVGRWLAPSSPRWRAFLNVLDDSVGFAGKWLAVATVATFGVLALSLWVGGFLFVSNVVFRVAITVVTFGALVLPGRFAYDVATAWRPRGKKFWGGERGARAGAPLRPRARAAKEARNVLVAFLFVACLNAAPLQLLLPTQRIVPATELADDEVLLDFHVHTDRSDGWLSPEERVEWYRAQGIDGAAFSDHQNVFGAKRAAEYVARKGYNFVVIPAVEYTSFDPDVHLNFYGLSEPVTPTGVPRVDALAEWAPNRLNVSDAIAFVKANGGFVTVNHYTAAPGHPFTYEQLRDWGVDGFEIVNGGDLQPASIRQFCLDNGLACVGGSDIHVNSELDTFVRLRLDEPNNRSVAAIFAALRRNEHQVVGVSLRTSKLHLPDWVGKFDDVESLAKYLHNLDAWQLASWLAWTAGTAALALVAIRVARRKPVPADVATGVVDVAVEAAAL